MSKTKMKIRKIMSLMLTLVCLLCTSSKVFAASAEEMPYFIINGEEIVYYGENYINSETGEYFIWKTNPNSRSSSSREFSFKIRNSVESSYFTINNTKVSVEANANVTDTDFNWVNGFNGFPYTVTIKGILSRKLDFEVGGTESGTISGLVNGGEYKVKIAKGNETLPSSPFPHYLSGDGCVSW